MRLHSTALAWFVASYPVDDNVKSFIDGGEQGLVALGKGLVMTVEHPIATTKGLVLALEHPKEAWKSNSDAFKQECHDKGESECLGKLAVQIAAFSVGPIGSSLLRPIGLISKSPEVARIQTILQPVQGLAGLGLVAAAGHNANF